MPRYSNTSTWIATSTRKCTCCVCKNPIPHREPHFRVYNENYSFKFCKPCMEHETRKLSNQWRAHKRRLAKQAAQLEKWRWEDDLHQSI